MAFGVARVSIDAAGGIVTGILAPKTYVNGVNIVVVGAAVTSHGIAPHDSPTMAEGTSRTTANGINVSRAGHLATCGHAVTGGTKSTIAS